MTIQIALIIVGCAVTALLTGAIFYLRDIKAGIAAQNDRHDKLQTQISDLKEALPKEYVRREDWIRSFSQIEQKIDAIWQFVHKIVGDKGGSDERH
jgi:hypothetical protein